MKSIKEIYSISSLGWLLLILIGLLHAENHDFPPEPLWFDLSAPIDKRMEAIKTAPPQALDTYDDNGFTGLMIAVASEQIPMVKLFIDRGVNLETQADSRYGGTALHAAVAHSDKNGSFAAFKMLLANGADVNARNQQGKTPAQKVFEMRNIPRRMQVVNTLVDYFADINSQDYRGYTLIHDAVASNDQSFIRNMMQTYADTINLNLKNKEGLTPLEYALSLGQADELDSVTSALREPLQVSDSGFFGYKAVNKHGQTALMFAVLREDLPQAQEYIAKGVNVNARTHQNKTALHYAVLAKNPVPFIQLLLDNGAQVNVIDAITGYTPLHLAAQINDPTVRMQVTKLLVDRGASLTIRDKRGFTPLDRAVELGDTNLVHYFSGLGKDKSGRTPYDRAQLYRDTRAKTPAEKATFDTIMQLLSTSGAK